MCVGEVFVELGEWKVNENNNKEKEEEEEEKHFESRFETTTHLKPHLG